MFPQHADADASGSWARRLRAAILGVACAAAMTLSAATAAPVMHVHDSSGNLGTVDVATGTVTVIGNMGVVMTDIGFDPGGNLYGRMD